MALYDKASLVLIPSGTKEGVVFSQKPTNGDGDFTFSRATAATRVNADGLIEKETQNLLLQSNQFDTVWGVGGTLVGGQTDKDGGSSAWSFTSSSGTSGLNQGITTGGVQTFSAYIKKNATNGVRIYMFGSINASPWFNLDTGSVVSLSNAVDATIVEYNSEWWRISVTCNSTLNSIYFYCTNNNQTQVVGTITIQDAQVEYGLVARDYIETTTAAVEGGITDNVPRLDYTGGATCPALLLEPSRTNLVTQSEYIDSWSKAGSLTISNNNDTSPEGTQNASLILPNAGSGNFGIINSISKSASSLTYTLSGFAKAKDYNFLILRIDSGAASGVKGAFDLSDGTISTAFSTNGSGFTFIDADIKAHTNNWYRYEVSFTTDSLALLRSIFYVSNVTGNGFSVPSYAANGTDGILFWGAQLEEGSYATSYIPTYGTSVTFAQDVCSKTGISSLIGQTEGTLFSEIYYKRLTTNYGITALMIINADGDFTNRIQLGIDQTHKLNAIFTNASAGQTVTVGSSNIQEGVHKLALKYTTTECKLFLDGVLLQTTALTIFPAATLGVVKIGNNFGNVTPINNGIKIVNLYKELLSDAEVIALTTI